MPKGRIRHVSQRMQPWQINVILGIASLPGADTAKGSPQNLNTETHKVVDLPLMNKYAARLASAWPLYMQ